MPTLMQVEVVSPDEELFSGEATFVLARTVEGDTGILATMRRCWRSWRPTT
jgi:F0F1-type ATP synthase epsilon subunit